MCSRAEKVTSASKIAELKWSLRDSWQNRDSSFSQDNFPTFFPRFMSVFAYTNTYFPLAFADYQGLRWV